MDNLTQKEANFGYIKEMIGMEPERYKGVAKYIDAYFEETENSYASKYDEDEYYDLAMFFNHYETNTKTYHWINKKKVSSKKWDEASGDGFYHWCSVLELYSPNEEVPLVLDYEEGKFWGLFGYDDFEAYASLTSGW